MSVKPKYEEIVRGTHEKKSGPVQWPYRVWIKGSAWDNPHAFECIWKLREFSIRYNSDDGFKFIFPTIGLPLNLFLKRGSSHTRTVIFLLAWFSEDRIREALNG